MRTDFHTHTYLSDGALSPAEHLRRAEVHGYEAIALTDHVDAGTVEDVVRALVRACAAHQPHTRMACIPGCEITHVPPAGIAEVVRAARAAGARLVLVHGETVSEPVAPGTNHAAIEAGCDVLAHPGLIREDELRLARDRGVIVEISAKGAHGLANGHVAALARRVGATLVVNGDAHAHTEFMTEERRRAVALGAGLGEDELARVLHAQARLAERLAGATRT